MAKSKASNYKRTIIKVKPLGKPMSVANKQKLLVKKSPPPVGPKAPQPPKLPKGL